MQLGGRGDDRWHRWMVDGGWEADRFYPLVN
jgi:hypothetical protein